MANVIVCCRLPNGLEIKDKNGKSIVLNGANTDPRGSSKFFIFESEFFGTTEVDAELWAEWVSRNQEFPAITNGAIFVAENERSAKAKAIEKSGKSTGFEPVKAEEHNVEPVQLAA